MKNPILKLTFILTILIFSFESNAQYSEVAYATTDAELNILDFDISHELNTPSQLFSINALNKSLDAAAKERHTLEKVGRTLTFVGIPLVVIGALILSDVDEDNVNCTGNVCDGDETIYAGAYALVFGVGMTGTGIVLWTIGSKK